MIKQRGAPQRTADSQGFIEARKRKHDGALCHGWRPVLGFPQRLTTGTPEYKAARPRGGCGAVIRAHRVIASAGCASDGCNLPQTAVFLGGSRRFSAVTAEVFAASRRSWRRSLPLRRRSRSHEQRRSFYTNLKKYKNSLTAYLTSASFYRRDLLWVCAPSFAVLAPPGVLLFTKSKPNNPNKPKKYYRRWPSAEVTEVNAAPPWRSRRSWRPFAETDGRLAVKTPEPPICVPGTKPGSAPSRPPTPPNGGLFQETPRRTPTRLRGCWFRGAACHNPPKHTSKTPAHSAPPREAHRHQQRNPPPLSSGRR